MDWGYIETKHASVNSQVCLGLQKNLSYKSGRVKFSPQLKKHSLHKFKECIYLWGHRNLGAKLA